MRFVSRVKSVVWNYEDAKRGALLGLITSLIYYMIPGSTSILGYYDYDLAHYSIEPYGRLWYLLNPFFQQWILYSISTVLIYAAVLIPQFWLVKKGRLNGWIVLLNILTVMVFRMNQSSQDITVIMFAPLATINPLFTFLLLAQKIAVGWSWNLSDRYFADWKYQVHNDPFQISYFLLAFWIVIPLIVWSLKWWKTDNIMKRLRRRQKNRKFFENLHCGDCISTGCDDPHCHCCNGGKHEPKEFHLPSWLWNRDAERGVILGLIVALVGIGIFGTNDTSLLIDIKNGVLPYGVLWTWMNPWWWTQQPYMMAVTLIECEMYIVQYMLVRRGRLSKDLVLMNLFTNVFLNATHVFQEGTVIMMGPLIAATSNPLVAFGIVAVMILEKLPIGWAVPWDLNNPHVQCGIFGQCIAFQNSRLDIARSDFFTHLAIIFWIVAPLMIFWKKRTGKMPFLNQLNWMNRHRKIMFLIWLLFMLGLVIYAVNRNGNFFTACVGYGPNDPKPSFC